MSDLSVNSMTSVNSVGAVQPFGTVDLLGANSAGQGRTAVLWPPVKWRPGIAPVTCSSGARVWITVCPECGEAAAPCNPRAWTVANGPFPQWAHAADGEPLCPVVGKSGYEPAPEPTWAEATSPVVELILAASRFEDGEG